MNSQGAPGAGESAVGSDCAGSGEASAPDQDRGWKFAAAWVAFALTLLWTLVLGVQVVLNTIGVD